MARLPLINADNTTLPSLKALFEGMAEMGLGKFSHQMGAMAHHPPLAGAFYGILQAYYAESVVPQRFLEMAILRVSALNRCNYCVVHHTPPALKAGLSEAQLTAIEEGSWREESTFGATERDVLEFVEQVSSRGGRVSDSLYARLGTVFDEKQLVELAVRTAMCEFFNRFNEIFQIDIEPIAEALYHTATGKQPPQASEPPPPETAG